MSKIKTVFFGTPQISVPALEALISDSRFDVIAVVTEPQKMKGRGQKEEVNSPIFEVAAKHKIKTLTPKSIKKDVAVQEQINAFGADVYVVIAYGKIIPEVIFAHPPHGTVNVHYSLLPDLRGPSPVQWALLEGRERTGVTLMKIDEEMDHGGILAQEVVEIDKDDTFVSLISKLNKFAVNILLQDLHLYIDGKIQPKEQDHAKATFCKMIAKDDGKVDWSQSARSIYNRWRAFVLWPGIYTEANGKRFNLKSVSVTVQQTQGDAGTMFAHEKKLYVTCGDGVIEVLEIQPEGKKVMGAQDFINGHKNLLDTKLTW